VKTVYLALGSNIGNRENNLRAAIENMASAGIRVVRESPIYETEPLGYTAQRWFLNMVAEAETALFPMQLLTRIGKIERTLGRVRTIPNGPRTIDIDILLYGTAVVRTPRLEIPHPRMHERRFVLAPLADLSPDLRHPVSRKTIRQMLHEAPPESLRHFNESPQKR
jgi:2-amino-4-hydroxy-6-hydroxymethyldihydropteridine diphosphokinase